MVNNIEKMMKTAGVEHNKCCKYAHYGYEGDEGTWYFCEKEQKECPTYPDEPGVCSKKETTLPDFTPEKQLEIIKLISKNDNEETIALALNKYENEYCFLYQISAGDGIFFERKRVNHKDFTQALAQLTTELMKAGELDKEKVKEILEC